MSNRRRNASIYGPILLLLLIGAAAYIITVKLTTPKVITLKAQPDLTTTQSSQSANLTATIQTTVTPPITSQVEQWQDAADSGQDTWHLDPLDTAKHLSLDYGFASSDTFLLDQSDSAAAPIVRVTHADTEYRLTMYQPAKAGTNGVWAIQSISQ